MIIITELNILVNEKNFVVELEGFKYDKNKVLLLFLKDRKHIAQENQNVLYDTKPNKKIVCKSCDFEIGYIQEMRSKNKVNYLVGLISVEKILSEEIKYSNFMTEKEIPVMSIFLQENLSLIKKFKLINDIATSYSRDFYRTELLDINLQMDNLELKVNKIIEKNEENEIKITNRNNI